MIDEAQTWMSPMIIMMPKDVMVQCQENLDILYNNGTSKRQTFLRLLEKT